MSLRTPSGFKTVESSSVRLVDGVVVLKPWKMKVVFVALEMEMMMEKMKMKKRDMDGDGGGVTIVLGKLGCFWGRFDSLFCCV